MDSPLFKDRTPEAAAWQLAVVLATAVECQIETLDNLPKSTSARERKRHERIARTLVFHCDELGVEPSGLNGYHCPRLAQALAQLRGKSVHDQRGD